MSEKKSVEALVSGGKATAGPPLGPMLGPLGVNIVSIINKINELTSDFSGVKVPVTVTVDVDTKSFEVTVGTPPTVALIVKELGIEKGSGKNLITKAGKVTKTQIREIAEKKMPDLNANDVEQAEKIIEGTARSMGIDVTK